MYDAIAAEAKGKGFTVVRLYWAYCVADSKNGNPSDDLSTEKEDFTTALNYVRNDLKFTDTNIFVGGKSLGTFVSFEVFVSQKSLQALLMLTPVCTDSETDPKNHKNVFAENYIGLETEIRPVLLAQGNNDPLCDSNHFQDFLKDKGTNFIPLVVKGNHSFAIQNPDGQNNVELSTKNLQTISKWIFTWLK
ncbi:MAG: alpha/beta family hydrolase [Bdellovibrio sp.]